MFKSLVKENLSRVEDELVSDLSTLNLFSQSAKWCVDSFVTCLDTFYITS